MGLTLDLARMLLSSRHHGDTPSPTCFRRVLTIGRQQLYLRPNDLDRLESEFDIGGAFNGFRTEWGEFCEPFLRQIVDCESIDSIDHSDFEAATILHDLNQPVPAELHEQYDLVLDGGTLEHIFHLPTAISNYINMLAVGGTLVLGTNANNHCGHGFYQFSPELFFRVFSELNGFEKPTVVLVQHPFPGGELSSHTRCMVVTDPDELRQRVGLVNDQPTMIMVKARRSKRVEPFSSPIFQSDYQRQWSSHELHSTMQAATPPAPQGFVGHCRRFVGNTSRSIQSRLPTSLKRQINGRKQLKAYSFGNRKFYHRWIP